MVYKILGYFGMTLALLAYFLVSNHVFTGQSFWYQFMNLLTGISLTASAVKFKQWHFAILNIVWSGIAAYALAHILR